MTIRYLGDLEPDLVLVLSATEPVDTTEATAVKIEASADKWATVLWTRTPDSVVVDEDDGTTTLTMSLQPGDTATKRRLDLRAVVTWPDTRPQTFPGGVLDVRKDADGIRL